MENLNVVNDTQQPVVEAAGGAGAGQQNFNSGPGGGQSYGTGGQSLTSGEQSYLGKGTSGGQSLADSGQSYAGGGLSDELGRAGGQSLASGGQSYSGGGLGGGQSLTSGGQSDEFGVQSGEQDRNTDSGDNQAADGSGKAGKKALDGNKSKSGAVQSAKDNAKFKDFRVREQKLTRELMQYQKVKDALGYKDISVDDFAAAVISAANGESVEQYKERQQAEIRALDAEQKLKYYEDMIISQKMESDLREIQKLDSGVKSLTDLGDKFSDLIALGWSARDAYKAVKSTIDRPPEIGAVNTAQNIESEFFSSDELDRLTQQQLDDPVIFRKAMKSLKKL